MQQSWKRNCRAVPGWHHPLQPHRGAHHAAGGWRSLLWWDVTSLCSSSSTAFLHRWRAKFVRHHHTKVCFLYQKPLHIPNAGKNNVRTLKIKKPMPTDKTTNHGYSINICTATEGKMLMKSILNVHISDLQYKDMNQNRSKRQLCFLNHLFWK